MEKRTLGIPVLPIVTDTRRTAFSRNPAGEFFVPDFFDMIVSPTEKYDAKENVRQDRGRLHKRVMGYNGTKHLTTSIHGF